MSPSALDGARSVEIVEAPDAAAMASVSALEPANPFLTQAYADARRALGAAVVLFAERDRRTGFVSGTLGYLEGGAAARRLEIASLGTIADGPAFWDAVRAYCRQRRVWDLEVGTFGSRTAVLPEWPSDHGARERTEWVLDLSRANWARDLTTNHRRSVQRAAKAGVTVVRTSEGAAEHAQLMGASMARRRDRGEDVPAVEDPTRTTTEALLASGAGILFRAERDGQVLSSLLVLLAPQGAYYHSAGTSPAGMEFGASTFLVHETARLLKEEGTTTFNLGGADSASEGLVRFKRGFGATPVALAAATYPLAPALLRKARTVGRLALHDRGRLLSALGRADTFVAYSAHPDAVARRAPSDPGITVRALPDEELERLAHAEPEFADQWRRRLQLGFNAAYGAERDGDVVHVAWLMEQAQDAASHHRNVRVRAHEAEITHCHTLSRCRGQGVYPVAIGALARVAAARGVRRLFMITNVRNVASRRGIERAGFAASGRIWRLWFFGGRITAVVRGHRLSLVRT